MKRIRIFSIISIICIVAFSACKNSKPATKEIIERSFMLGSGGGFTGQYNTYKIYNSGKVEQQNGEENSFAFFKNIPRDSATVCFSMLDALLLSNQRIDKPGNMTYYIKSVEEYKSFSIKWGAGDYNIRKDIEAFFKRTKSMVRADYN